MSKKYIIELEDEPTYISDGIGYFKCLSAPWWMIGDNLIGRLKPYDPDDGTEGAKCEFCTVYGYPIRHLVLFAAACRKNGVEEHDMRFFAQNAEIAFKYVRRDLEESLERAFNDQVDRLWQKDEDAWERFRQRDFVIPPNGDGRGDDE